VCIFLLLIAFAECSREVTIAQESSVVAPQTAFLKGVLEGEVENDFPFTSDSFGIDVSAYQPNTDWNRVMNANFHGRKVEFVFIKATEGIGFTSSTYMKDSKAVSQYSQVKVKGAYHFFRTSSSGKAQAEYMMSILEKDPYFNKATDYYVIDTEANSSPTWGKQDFAANVNMFIDTMQAAGYQNPIIYTTYYFWNDNVGQSGDKIWNRAKLWLARYGVNDGEIPQGDKWYTLIPSGATKAHIWQFTDKGRVDGTSGDVDMDLIRSDF